MGKKAFDKIAAGLDEILTIARDEALPVRINTPRVTFADRLENEARDRGWQCSNGRCRYWNLAHRRLCKRCGNRGRSTPTQEKAARARRDAI